VRSNVTQLVDRLEADGLVRRGTCTEDRRAIRAKVTPVGLERHRAGVAAIRVVQQEVAERLAPGDRAELVRLLSSALG
jgi:DNA-binding MarR family transcriptional regulator